MKLCPFNASSKDNQWLKDAPLYGGSGYPHPRDQYTYEIFPVHPDEDVGTCEPIPRDGDEYRESSVGFDIVQADESTEYVRIIETGDRPRLKWYSRDQFRHRFCYDPLHPPRPRGVGKTEWQDYNEDRITSTASEYSLQTGTDAMQLLGRIGRLWNGDVVRGKHLLWDKCPRITEFADDLETVDLHQLYHDTDFDCDVLLVFGDADWFNTPTGYLKSTTILRKRVWYDLENKGRMLLNEHSKLPTLSGDPYEGLVHRVTVGLLALRNKSRGWQSSTYYSVDDYVIDVAARDDTGQRYAYEMMTDHHNWELYRSTYLKMKDLNKRNIKPVAIFNSRDTAYRFFNHIHNKGLATLPNGTFNSDYSIPNGRSAIKNAYDSMDDWDIADWTTTSKLYQQTLGQDGPELNRSDVVSLNW